MNQDTEQTRKWLSRSWDMSKALTPSHRPFLSRYQGKAQYYLSGKGSSRALLIVTRYNRVCMAICVQNIL